MSKLTYREQHERATARRDAVSMASYNASHRFAIGMLGRDMHLQALFAPASQDTRTSSRSRVNVV